jgi:hypothetical protein
MYSFADSIRAERNIAGSDTDFLFNIDMAQPFRDIVLGDNRQMLRRKIKLIQSAVALILLGCAVCPFVEFILHWNSSIFLTGHDTESTVAFLLLLIELSFAIAKLLAFVGRTILQRRGIVSCSNRAVAKSSIFSEILPAASPPVPLRI